MKYLKQLMALCVLLASAHTLKAYDFEYEGIAYNILSTTELTCEVAPKEEKYAGEITIPEKVEFMGRTLTVTALGESCFEECSNLTKVNLPNSVSGVISYRAFYGCDKITSIKIPDKVKKLGSDCFAYCVNLKSIELPSLLNYMGSNCFKDCSSLESIQLPSGIKELPLKCFSGCVSLKSIIIPKGVTTIADDCFNSCKSLESIDIPEGVTWIGNRCFRSCTSLKSLTLPNTTTNCGNDFIDGCTSLKSLVYGGKLDSYDLYGASALNSLTLTRSVSCIGLGAFDNIPLLELIIEDGDSSIEYERYEELQFDTLEYLYLGRDFNNFYPNGTLFCPNIKHLTFGANISSVGSNFYYSLKRCEKLVKIQCNSTTPPSCAQDEFSNKQYASAEVLVPDEAVDTYKQAEGWKYFWNIKGISQSSIDEVAADVSDKVEVGRFDTLGRPVSEGYNGIVIIKYSDGSTDKIYQVQ